MKKEFMRILLDSCDKKRLVNSLVEMIRDDDQLAWIMGMVPSMDENFVSNHYSSLLSTATTKFDKDYGNDGERIVAKVCAANYPWDLPYVKFVVKKKVFVTDSSREVLDKVTVKIEEYLSENNKPSFDELDKLIDKYPYSNKKNTGNLDYPNEVTYYSIVTVYLYADDIAHVIEE